LLIILFLVFRTQGREQELTMPGRITANRIAVHKKKIRALARWYNEKCGFTARSCSDGSIFLQPPEKESAGLRLIPTDKLGNSGDSGYWKIGVGVPDAKYTVRKLVGNGVKIGMPRQFRDVGYLCHMADPAGNAIEILQDTFEYTPTKQTPPVKDHPLGCKAKIGQITIRARDIKRTTRFYEKLGMKFVCSEDVGSFDLYFYAFTEKKVPNTDTAAVENREWTYSLPCTTLEVQHVHNSRYSSPKVGEEGWQGMEITLPENQRAEFMKRFPSFKNGVVSDPDGYQVHVRFQ